MRFVSAGPEREKAASLAAAPAALWLAAFFLAPLVIVAIYSFATRGPYGSVELRFGFQNFGRAFDPLYLRILLQSVWLALLTAVSCLIAGFPVAYTLARARPALRSLLLVLVVVPFWTNFVVRTYALKAILAENGPINSLLLSLGVIREAIAFGNSPFAVWLGMLINYLPFMVLPLFVSIEKFDFSLLEAARDLGANERTAFFRILVPGVRKGIATGLVLVFAPSLGEFVIPDLLGGAKVQMVGGLITDQFLKSRDWPFGAALSLVLVLAAGAAAAVLRQREEQG